MIHVRLAILACVAFALPLIAQQPAQGHLRVTIRDQSTTAIPHAQVQIMTASKAPVVSAYSDNTGKVSIDLPSGQYLLLVAEQGFSNSQQEIALQPGTSLAIPVTMKIGMQGPITVEDPGPPLPAELFQRSQRIPLVTLCSLGHLPTHSPRK